MIADQLRTIRTSIASLVEGRDATIQEQNLDKQFCLPDVNWGPDAANDYQHKYELLRDAESPENIFCSLTENFTGNCISAIKSQRPQYEDNFSSIMWRIANGIDELPGSTQQPSPYLYRPLLLPDERGLVVDGAIVNSDTIRYQKYLNLMVLGGVIDELKQIRHPIIVEIGAGYGALALALHQALGDNILYVICDLPEALLFSGIYLTLAMRHTAVMKDGGGIIPNKSGIMLVPNYAFHTLEGLNGKVDLVVNTLSMGEMSEYQVNVYTEGVSNLIGDRGVFFEHNYYNSHIPGMINCKKCIQKYFTHFQVGMDGGLCHFWSNKKGKT